MSIGTELTLIADAPAWALYQRCLEQGDAPSVSSISAYDAPMAHPTNTSTISALVSGVVEVVLRRASPSAPYGLVFDSSVTVLPYHRVARVDVGSAAHGLIFPGDVLLAIGNVPAYCIPKPAIQAVQQQPSLELPMTVFRGPGMCLPPGADVTIILRRFDLSDSIGLAV
jgi:hypothetical protein